MLMISGWLGSMLMETGSGTPTFALALLGWAPWSKLLTVVLFWAGALQISLVIGIMSSFAWTRPALCYGAEPLAGIITTFLALCWKLRMAELSWRVIQVQESAGTKRRPSRVGPTPGSFVSTRPGTKSGKEPMAASARIGPQRCCLWKTAVFCLEAAPIPRQTRTKQALLWEIPIFGWSDWMPTATSFGNGPTAEAPRTPSEACNRRETAVLSFLDSRSQLTGTRPRQILAAWTLGFCA